MICAGGEKGKDDVSKSDPDQSTEQPQQIPITVSKHFYPPPFLSTHCLDNLIQIGHEKIFADI